jgi:hypothetical protein
LRKIGWISLRDKAWARTNLWPKKWRVWVSSVMIIHLQAKKEFQKTTIRDKVSQKNSVTGLSQIKTLPIVPAPNKSISKI